MKSRAERQSQKKVESEESRISRKKIHTSVTKVAKFFSMIGGSDGSKSRLAKAAGAEVAIQRRKKKLHAAAARRAFSSQNSKKKLMVLDHFFKFRCRKNAC